MVSLLTFERKQNNYSNPFRIRIFLFLSYSSGIETISTCIHSVVPSKTQPDSRPKWAKCIPVFRPKRAKTLPDGAAHTYMAYIRKYPPPGRYCCCNYCYYCSYMYCCYCVLYLLPPCCYYHLLLLLLPLLLLQWLLILTILLLLLLLLVMLLETLRLHYSKTMTPKLSTDLPLNPEVEFKSS